MTIHVMTPYGPETAPENTLLEYYRRIANRKATLKNNGCKEVTKRLILELLEEREQR